MSVPARRPIRWNTNGYMYTFNIKRQMQSKRITFEADRNGNLSLGIGLLGITLAGLCASNGANESFSVVVVVFVEFGWIFR